MEFKKEIDVSSEVKLYLDEIAERLWTGHAAIMVGSGFSKNADPKVGNKNTFPNWNELGDIFYKKLYGKRPGDNERYLNPLKLAEEVSAVFGRPTLGRILLDNIPDNDHNPTELYTKLLQLGWSDVFTTNYDTLLERAKDDVTDRNYQVVVKKDDLVNSKSPRIIKLHGSFPSHTPFIITEEDYRSYPKKFAPFVNTVQQALLEKTLCLIGFSGDDPNFLQWIGWIRDNFEENTALKIYLVGIINLPEAQKKLLEKRNVNIIDLADCPRVNGNHGQAIERFFDYLQSKKAEGNRLGWPKDLGFPDLNNKDKCAEVRKGIEKLKEAREEFPGWRIVPNDRRSSLRRVTNSWVKFVSNDDDLPNFIDIQYIYELCWQLDKSLLPVWDNIAEMAEKCLGKYWPFPDINTKGEQSVIASDPHYKKIDWASVKEQWIQISLYMLRYYREEGLHAKWKEREGTLEEVTKYLSDEQSASLNYEQALELLFQLDIQALKKQLNVWPSNKSLPFWEAKRAGLLAEIGQVEEAEKILELSLKTIRAQQNLKPVSTDYSDVSDEAYLMLLLQCVKQSVLTTKGSFGSIFTPQNEFSERFNLLHQYKCSPWTEISQFETKLCAFFVENKAVSQIPAFRIGHVTTTHNLIGSNEGAEDAFSFLRFCEDIGLAYRLPGVNVALKSAHGSIARIRKGSQHWALITLLRMGDKKAADEIFNRKSVFKLTVSHCDQLIELYLKKLSEFRGDIASDSSIYAVNFGESLAKIMPVILSRLCCKASSESKEKLLDFIIEVYSSDHKSKFEGIGDLVSNLIDSMGESHLYQSIPKFLNIAIPEDLTVLTESEFRNPFVSLGKEVNFSKNTPSIALDKDRVSYFLGKALSDDKKIREWATFTLLVLDDLRLLSGKQRHDLGNAVWGIKDGQDFPLNTRFYKYSWINRPNPQKIDIESLLRNYILELKIPVQSQSEHKGIGISGGYDHRNIANELIGASKYIRFESDIYISWLEKIRFWWNADKKYLDDSSNITTDEFRKRFSCLTSILSEFILPNLKTEIDENSKGKINAILNDLELHGIPAVQARAASSHLFANEKGSTISKIESLFSSKEHYAVEDAKNAMLTVIKNTHKVFLRKEQRFMVDLALQAMIWNSCESINSGIYLLCEVIKTHPVLFNAELKNKITLALKITADNTDLTYELSTMSFDEKLGVRKNVSYMAYTLYCLYLEKDLDVPDEILTWKTICESEQEFAEIRNQWKSCD